MICILNIEYPNRIPESQLVDAFFLYQKLQRLIFPVASHSLVCDILTKLSGVIHTYFYFELLIFCRQIEYKKTEINKGVER